MDNFDLSKIIKKICMIDLLLNQNFVILKTKNIFYIVVWIYNYIFNIGFLLV